MIAWHDGGPSEGIGSVIALLPEHELGVVLVANEISFEGSISVAMATDILEVMIETKFGPRDAAAPPEQPVSSPELGRELLSSFEGTYVVYGTTMDVRRNGNRLAAQVQGMNLDLIPTSANQFSVSHWLSRTGLANLIPTPVDLNDLSVTFLPPNSGSPASMVSVAGGIAFERGDRYPEFAEISADWVELVGRYQRHFRTGTRSAGEEAIGDATISFEDGILSMSGVIGPIIPADGDQIIIVGGPFAGETMEYECSTGRIFHQGHVYVRSVLPSAIHG